MKGKKPTLDLSSDGSGDQPPNLTESPEHIQTEPVVGSLNNNPDVAPDQNLNQRVATQPNTTANRTQPHQSRLAPSQKNYATSPSAGTTSQVVERPTNTISSNSTLNQRIRQQQVQQQHYNATGTTHQMYQHNSRITPKNIATSSVATSTSRQSSVDAAIQENYFKHVKPSLSFMKESKHLKEMTRSQLDSLSAMRRCCYRVKYRMVNDQYCNNFITILIGFIINLFPMTTVLLIYEVFQDDGQKDQQFYSALYPVITLFSVLLFLTCFSIGVLAKDLLQRGCLTWHRNSLGQLLQQIIVFSCLLASICKCTRFIKDNEMKPQDLPSFWPCMTPLIVLCVLLLFKLLMFRTKSVTFVYIVAISTLIALAFVYETHFDASRYESPLFLLVLPFVFILICLTLHDLVKVYYEVDECKRVFWSYWSSCKRFFKWWNFCVTLSYCTSIIIALMTLEKTWTSQQEDTEIIEMVIWSSMIYFALMSEFTGGLCQSLWFSQFQVEMVDQLVVSKKIATYKRLKNSWDRQQREIQLVSNSISASPWAQISERSESLLNKDQQDSSRFNMKSTGQQAN